MAELSAEQFSESRWTSLRYFSLYRFAVSAILFVSALLYPSAFTLLTPYQGLQHLLLAAAYLLATAFAVILAYRHRGHSSLQLTASVLTDIAVMTLLIHIGGGLGSGLGSMLLVTLAGAGLVGEGRLVLFYAAMASLAVLIEQSFRALLGDLDTAAFFHAGVFSAGFFAIAISARLLARRVIANEELARQRGLELRNQMLISQRVIEEMQDGVLVLSREGRVKQSNPQAAKLLALDPSDRRLLAECSPDLVQGFADWCRSPSDGARLVSVPATGMDVQARFIRTASSESDVLVILEDTGRLREQAQQLKLAALGRLTANIAHEIRNPLSAITHAGELLREERRGEIYERLLRIVLDNARRLERIVRDVLDLGRRDRTYRESIALREALPSFLEEYLAKEEVAPEVVELTVSGSGTLCFDRSHFHRVLWNLLGNALRYSRRLPGSVCLSVADAKLEGGVEIHVVDDGEGVSENLREQIFEPFFTTYHRGNGLGLYIARELCEANEAKLELLGSGRGADFRILGRAVGCQ
jgi:two-component system sensor histidine kinase PilS (NtrC family)